MTAAIDLATIPTLRAIWARTTLLEPIDTTMPVPARPLTDMLGLGLEQTVRHLGQERPGFENFLQWVTKTAGPADPDRVARYCAWVDGSPPPARELARQATIAEAQPVLSAAELQTWDEDGVVVLRNAIEPCEASAIAAHLWTLLGASPEDPASWYGSRNNGIMIQHFQHPTMDVPRRSMRIAKAFAELYGHADLVASIDRLSFNPPETANYHFPGPHLHWDGNLTPPIPFETQAILYLTDTESDQGALQVVPGFHHRLADGWLTTLAGANPREIDLSADARMMPAQAGDMVIWRHEIPHGASANRSERPRLAQYVNHYPMHWPDERPWL